ncbi:S1 family peptidase [Stenotrophomonas sp.]|uniref:S1 family peptidase n=1 Tax=Stenotrophomonas sp. TaxID=69392 RepID=UPI0031D0F635
MKTSAGSRNLLTPTVALLAASAIFNLNAATQDRDIVAEKYADTYRTSTKEATQRLAASRDAGRLQRRIATENPETFAGLYIEHSPEFQIVVLFTKDPERHLAKYTQSRLYSAKVAPRSLEMLLAAQEEAGERLSRSGIRFESGIDIRRSEVELRVLDARRTREVLTELLAATDFIRIHETTGFPQPTALIGGTKVSGPRRHCTMGFNVVEHDTRELGIVTAGHCDNNLTYSNSTLQLLYQDESDAGNYDVQWNKQRVIGTPKQQRNEIVVEGSPETIISETASADLAVGMPVCKSGATTGHTCGEVADINAATEDYNGLPASYVRAMNADDLEMNAAGDSGGPVFSGEAGHRSAYGIVHARGAGDRINHLYFMPIERLSILGVTTLTIPFEIEGAPDVSGPSPSIPVDVHFKGYPRFPVELTLEVLSCPVGWTCTGGTKRYTANIPSPMTFTWGCDSSAPDWPKHFKVRTHLKDASGITTDAVETNIACTGPAVGSANQRKAPAAPRAGME